MKKVITILIYLLFATGFSQEREDHALMANKFMSLYNADDYEGIFNTFDDNMKNALPKEKAIAFFKGNVSPLGKLKSMEFTGIEQGTHLYKSTFDQTVFDILLSVNDSNQMNGLLIKPHKPKNLPTLDRNTTKMILPFKEKWFVFWGGTTVEQNYHMAQEVQQYAYDLMMAENGSSHKGDPKKNESYFVFGKDIIAPCDGKIVKVVKGVHDNIPGEMNPKDLTGNTLVLETDKKEYVLFAHLKQNSILVKEGEMVKQGQTIAQCGNSGNSTEAHLHLQLQNVPDFFQATGAKLFFDEIMVNGQIKKDYIPVKEDFIQNIKK
ncbi:peptidoglycan DD-metalloendopeptidase family protein [Spongiivirga citrea]|uniref:Peptidoglycan DD-metalloendopeptidase family protein n=1 Tax=Spongiivirga citrea TaxID=1481457 RepID=A0A6M0CJA3_9FLAO|nr:peptidoglycan DD-metalloendopeptidase family protein [Spongiivirga citrea]NER18018.1 peptidoglycan DD-metalloendopeptidase family protein [Spongiivirga citrea]